MDSLGGFMLMTVLSALVTPLFGIVVILPLVLYLIARWRSYREGTGDPQLGLKVALSYFRVLAYQLVLAGVFLLVWALMSDASDDTQEQILRTAGGLAVPGVIIFAAHNFAIAHTNQREQPVVGRLFGGLNLILTGLFGFLALSAAGFLFFQKNADKEIQRMLWSGMIVYNLAWVMQGLLFSRSVRTGPAAGLFGGAAAPPK